jgi:hypothetical protein
VSQRLSDPQEKNPLEISTPMNPNSRRKPRMPYSQDRVAGDALQEKRIRRVLGSRTGKTRSSKGGRKGCIWSGLVRVRLDRPKRTEPISF